MNDYTAGPWQIQKYVNYEGWSIWGSEDGCIAERWYASPRDNSENARMQANARLIAAAPDLLAAAEGVMGDELDLSQCPYFMGTGQCSSSCYSEPSCQTDRPLNGWPKERLAAAIKKAKGQQ